jgi:hypothetical protein
MLSLRGSKRCQIGIPVLLAVLLAGCGSGGGPQSDPDAVASTLKDAAAAVADGDGDKACGYLTADAQRQAELQVGTGVLGNVDCPTLVKRATAFMAPLDKEQIKDLEPQNIQVNGSAASARMATSVGTPQGGQPMSVQLNLQKVGSDWKISGFQNAVGLPGA